MSICPLLTFCHRPLLAPLIGISTCRLSFPHSLHTSHVFNEIQVLVLSTWTIILSNDPKSLAWFSFHPTLNTLAVACFTFGPFPPVSSRHKTNYMRAYRHPHPSTNVPAKDESCWSLAPSDRDDYRPPGYRSRLIGHVVQQRIPRRSSHYHLARCTSVSTQCSLPPLPSPLPFAGCLQPLCSRLSDRSPAPGSWYKP